MRAPYHLGNGRWVQHQLRMAELKRAAERERKLAELRRLTGRETAANPKSWGRGR